MLSNFAIAPIFPAKDLEKSRKFYNEMLGLEKGPFNDENLASFKCGNNTMLVLYKKDSFPASEVTNAGFDVQNIEELVKELTDKGVVFEQYDMGELKTDEMGIATMGPIKSAWLKDPDGNIIALNQM